MRRRGIGHEGADVALFEPKINRRKTCKVKDTGVQRIVVLCGARLGVAFEDEITPVSFLDVDWGRMVGEDNEAGKVLHAYLRPTLHVDADSRLRDQERMGYPLLRSLNEMGDEIHRMVECKCVIFGQIFDMLDKQGRIRRAVLLDNGRCAPEIENPATQSSCVIPPSPGRKAIASARMNLKFKSVSSAATSTPCIRLKKAFRLSFVSRYRNQCPVRDARLNVCWSICLREVGSRL